MLGNAYHFFVVWLFLTKEPRLSPKFVMSIKAFHHVYPNQSINVFTLSPQLTWNQALSHAKLSAEERSVLIHREVNYTSLMSICIDATGLPLQKDLHTEPFFQRYYVMSDVIRLCIGYVVGGFYFDVDIIHLQQRTADFFASRVVYLGDHGCPMDHYYYSKCTALGDWFVEEANGNLHVERNPRYVINGLFNFPNKHDPFLKRAIGYCLRNTHLEEGDCWSCCGPGAFSHALSEEHSREKHQRLRIISQYGSLYCDQALKEDTVANEDLLRQGCYTMHLFGGAQNAWKDQRFKGSILQRLTAMRDPGWLPGD